jgi:hypothetical protein
VLVAAGRAEPTYSLVVMGDDAHPLRVVSPFPTIEDAVGYAARERLVGFYVAPLDAAPVSLPPSPEEGAMPTSATLYAVAVLGERGQVEEIVVTFESALAAGNWARAEVRPAGAYRVAPVRFRDGHEPPAGAARWRATAASTP